MSERPDPLEEELAALEPRAVSPELRLRIAGRLSAPPSRGRGRMRRFALVGSLAAAGLAAVWLARDPGPGAGHALPPGPGPRPAPQARAEDAPPTLQAYRLALSRSPEALDALLDRHAARVAGSGSRLVRLRALDRPDPDARSFPGEF